MDVVTPKADSKKGIRPMAKMEESRPLAAPKITPTPIRAALLCQIRPQATTATALAPATHRLAPMN